MTKLELRTMMHKLQKFTKLSQKSTFHKQRDDTELILCKLLYYLSPGVVGGCWWLLVVVGGCGWLLVGLLDCVLAWLIDCLPAYDY